jgi:hypothetical protein
MATESIKIFMALLVGFAVAGAIANAYQAMAARPLSFGLLVSEAQNVALRIVPLLVMAAPFIIMETTLRNRSTERNSVIFVALATVTAGVWSMLSGTLVAGSWIRLVRLMA